MRSILDEFERKTVEMHQPDGTIHVTGWIYGEIAILPTILDDEPVWCLSCVPRGVAFPTKTLGLFKSIEDACGAAKALAKLNNCWALTDDIGPFTDRLKKIGRQFNGKTNVYPEGEDSYQAAVDRPFLNGATREQYHQ